MSNIDETPPVMNDENVEIEMSEQTSGSHLPTIGETTISTDEEQAI